MQNKNEFRKLQIFLASFFAAFGITTLIMAIRIPKTFTMVIIIAPIFLILSLTTIIFDSRIKEITWGNFKIIKALENKVEDLTSILLYTLKSTASLIAHSPTIELPSGETKGLTNELKGQFIGEILNLLKEYNIEDKENYILEEYYKVRCSDYCFKILEGTGYAPPVSSEELVKSLTAKDYPLHNRRLSPKKLEEALNDMGFEWPKHKKEQFEEYKDFYKTHNL